MAREYDHLFKLLIIGDSGMFYVTTLNSVVENTSTSVVRMPL